MTKKILLVDDENDFTELTSTLLGFYDFEVTTFNDPLGVEASIKDHHYDVIVSDLMMPGMDGFALVDCVRAMADYKKTPIVVLSAKTLTDEERKRLMLQEVHFIAKPFDPQDLVEKVTAVTKMG